MKLPIRIVASILLLFNGIGAIYGGWNLIIHPDGSSIGLSLNLLNHSPFHDYLIPGVVLFVINGLFSILVCMATIMSLKGYQRLIMLQGILLAGWIIVQIMLIQTVFFLHIIMGVVGLALIFNAFMLKKSKAKVNKPEAYLH